MAFHGRSSNSKPLALFSRKKGNWNSVDWRRLSRDTKALTGAFHGSM